jgi:hypothetical protein
MEGTRPLFMPEFFLFGASQICDAGFLAVNKCISNVLAYHVLPQAQQHISMAMLDTYLFPVFRLA